MKLLLERDAALAAIGRARGMVLTATTMPILQNLKLEARGGGLIVTGADPDMQAMSEAAAQVSAPGAVTVPAARFHDAVKSLPPGGQLSLSVGDGEHRLVVQCGRSRFQLPTLPAADYPVFDAGAAAHTATIAAKALLHLIDRTAFAISTEQTRYYITGLNLHHLVADGRALIRAVATDGARLGYAEMECPEGWSGAPAVTVPRKAVGEIRRLLDGLAGEVTISTNGRVFGVEGGGGRILTKLIEADFPGYERVIPRDLARKASMDVTELAAGLKRCEIMCGDKARAVRLGFAPGALTLRSRDGGGAEADETLDLDYDGEPLELLFNARILGEIAAQVAGERMVLKFGGQRDPSVMLDPTAPGVLYVCMPLAA